MLYGILNTYFNAIFLFWIGVFFFIIAPILPHIYFCKGSILFFEKELSSIFNIIEKKSLETRDNLPEELYLAEDMIFRFHGIKSRYRDGFFKYEYLKMYYEKFLACIGIIEKKKWRRLGLRARSVIRRKRWIAESNIFFSVEVPYEFKYATYVGFPRNLAEIGDIEKFKENIIVPKYSNISTIFYTDREYAEKILSEAVQKKISDLVIEIKNMQLGFRENKIILIIPNSRWSTLFSKVFDKKRNVRNILKVIETALASLKEIADEIEMNNNY